MGRDINLDPTLTNATSIDIVPKQADNMKPCVGTWTVPHFYVVYHPLLAT